MKLAFLLFLTPVLLVPLPASAQTPGTEGYLQDFEILTTSMRELYPMFYTFKGKDAVENSITETKQRLSQAKSKLQAIYIIQSFIYQFEDVHANLSSYADLGVERVLPFKVRIIKDELYVKDWPGKPTFAGAKIITIDGHKSANIIDSLEVLYPSDGNNVSGLVLQPLFNSFYGAFIDQRDTFRVVTDKGILIVPCVRKNDTLYHRLIRNSWQDYMVTDKQWVKKEVTDNYGYFRLLSFDKKIDGIHVETEFRNLIEELNKKNIRNLVIDLRYNSGGDPYLAGRMAAMLTDQPFKIFESLIVSKPQSPTFKKLVKFNYPGRTKGIQKVGDHYEKTSGDRGLTLVRPKQIFTGKVIVITGSMTESASTMFCRFLDGRKDVIFIGSETPGATNFFCAHKHCGITLPNTGAEASFGLQLIELKRGCSSTEKPAGLIPSVKIEYSLADYLSKKDLEMEWIRLNIH